jgi:hypothetical protein
MVDLAADARERRDALQRLAASISAELSDLDLAAAVTALAIALSLLIRTKPPERNRPMPTLMIPDPIHILIAEWRAEAERLNGSAESDPDGRFYGELTEMLFRTEPTTLGGALALVEAFLADAEDCDEDPRPVLRSVAGILRKYVAGDHRH